MQLKSIHNMKKVGNARDELTKNVSVLEIKCNGLEGENLDLKKQVSELEKTIRTSALETKNE